MCVNAVSRDLPVGSETIQTSLHLSSVDEYYTYTNVPWKLYLRKEVRVLRPYAFHRVRVGD